MSKIPRRICACFPPGGICKPEMQWLSFKELLGILAGSSPPRSQVNFLTREGTFFEDGSLHGAEGTS
jgi:hypothetical protein